MMPDPPLTHREADESSGEVAPRDTRGVSCCVVGGGPAGAVLALLLARQGISVLLLEEHGDFDRDFRGDTIHPSTMEVMAEIGLADGVLALPHTKIYTATIQTADGPFTVADFRHVRTRYPFVTFMPQKTFLEFVTTQAQRYPGFQLMMGARVERLIEEDGAARGVLYRAADGWHAVRATLTVGADGRFSRLRRLAGFEPIKTSPPIDVLWFRLPRRPDDPAGALGRPGGGHLFVLLNRGEQWQIADVIAKGSYQRLRAEGIEALRASIAAHLPELADRVDSLRDWKQVSLLSVESNRLACWYRPGLLLIGDAAHTMSPVGGVGINYAIQDAVVAANILASPLRAGQVRLDDLAAVQRQREWPTRIIQSLQTLAQKAVFARVLGSREALRVPPIVRFLLGLPGLRALPPRLVGFGLTRVHVRAASTPPK